MIYLYIDEETNIKLLTQYVSDEKTDQIITKWIYKIENLLCFINAMDNRGQKYGERPILAQIWVKCLFWQRVQSSHTRPSMRDFHCPRILMNFGDKSGDHLSPARGTKSLLS